MKTSIQQLGGSVSSPYSCFPGMAGAEGQKLLPPLSRAWCAILQRCGSPGQIP